MALPPTRAILTLWFDPAGGSPRPWPVPLAGPPRLRRQQPPMPGPRADRRRHPRPAHQLRPALHQHRQARCSQGKRSTQTGLVHRSGADRCSLQPPQHHADRRDPGRSPTVTTTQRPQPHLKPLISLALGWTGAPHDLLLRMSECTIQDAGDNPECHSSSVTPRLPYLRVSASPAECFLLGTARLSDGE
jgi:hypothetical protein